MHAAPPVSVRGTGGPAWRAVQALLPGLAAGVFAFWVLAHADLPIAAAAGPALAAALVGWWQARAVAATLAWDGQSWSVDGQPGNAQVMIDLDRWVLLRCQPETKGAKGAGRRWLAIAAGEAGAQWPLLRAALHARPPRPTTAGVGVVRGPDV